MDFDLAYRRLLAAEPIRSAEVSQAVANEFGDALLTARAVPDGYLDFICRIVADPVLAARPGTEALISGLYFNREKLSGSQLAHVFARMAASYALVADEHLAWVIGDFVAREAAPERALALLREMTAKSASRHAVAGVFLGLDILRIHRLEHGMPLAVIETAVSAAETRSAQFGSEPAIPAANLVARIARAFLHREKPAVVAVPLSQPDCDVDDALWFEGHDWRDLTPMEWREHPGAFFRFTPEAFRYYLPSILCIVAQCRDAQSMEADALLSILDRSPDIAWWDRFVLDKLLGLKDEEYQVMQEWILMLSVRGGFYREDGLVRAYETVALLRQESEKAWHPTQR